LMDYDMRLAGRSYHQIAEAGGGILASVRAVREMPIRRLILQARQTLNACIQHGTTTLEAKSGYGLDETGERKALRAVRALQDKPLDLIPTYLGAHTGAARVCRPGRRLCPLDVLPHHAPHPAAQAGNFRRRPLRARRFHFRAGAAVISPPPAISGSC